MKLIYRSLCSFTLLLAASLCAGATGLAREASTVKPLSTLKYTTPHAEAKAASTNVSRASESAEPEGEERVYETNWMQLFGDAIVDNTGLAHRVRFADNGKVYFHDFFAAGYDFWIEGTINDKGVITIPTHQKVAEIELIKDYFVDVTIELSTFDFSEDYMSSNVDLAAESFTLQLKEDGSIVSPDLDKDWTERTYPVAYARKKVYALCGSINMMPCTLTLAEVPSGLTEEELSYTYRQQDMFTKAVIIKAMFDGDDVYIQGLCTSLPEIWLKGTFNSDRTKLVFKSGQYMGFGQYHHMFSAAHRNPNASPDNPYEPNWIKDDELVLNVEADGKTFTFNAYNRFAVTINGDVAYTLNAAKLKPRNDAAVGTPMKPVITTAGELLWLEAEFLPFVQPNADMDGNYIDTANLSWRLYYDDELFTFTPGEYQYLDEAKDEMPYCYDDRWDFIVYTDVMEQCVAIYAYGYKNIGVESVYRNGDKMTVSERAYFGEAPSSSVATVDVESPVVETVYYDLTGRKVATPQAGLYIRSDKHADGSVTTHKMRVR